MGVGLVGEMSLVGNFGRSSCQVVVWSALLSQGSQVSDWVSYDPYAILYKAVEKQRPDLYLVNVQS